MLGLGQEQKWLIIERTVNSGYLLDNQEKVYCDGRTTASFWGSSNYNSEPVGLLLVKRCLLARGREEEIGWREFVYGRHQ